MIEGGVQDLKAGFQAESAVQGSWRQSEEVRKISKWEESTLYYVLCRPFCYLIYLLPLIRGKAEGCAQLVVSGKL